MFYLIPSPGICASRRDVVVFLRDVYAGRKKRHVVDKCLWNSEEHLRRQGAKVRRGMNRKRELWNPILSSSSCRLLPSSSFPFPFLPSYPSLSCSTPILPVYPSPYPFSPLSSPFTYFSFFPSSSSPYPTSVIFVYFGPGMKNYTQKQEIPKCLRDLPLYQPDVPLLQCRRIVQTLCATDTFYASWSGSFAVCPLVMTEVNTTKPICLVVLRASIQVKAWCGRVVGPFCKMYF